MVSSAFVHAEVEGRWILNFSQQGSIAAAQIFEGPRAEFNAAVALYDYLLSGGASAEQLDDGNHLPRPDLRVDDQWLCSPIQVTVIGIAPFDAHGLRGTR